MTTDPNMLGNVKIDTPPNSAAYWNYKNIYKYKNVNVAGEK